MNYTNTSTIGGLIVLALIIGSGLLFLSFYRRYKRAASRDNDSDESSN